MADSGYSGLFNEFGGVDYSPMGRNDTVNGTTRSELSRIFRTREGKKLGALIKALILEEDAESTHVQRKAVESDQFQNYGGVVEYETISDVNRAVSAEDKALIVEIIDEVMGEEDKPYDASGNNDGSILERFGII